MALAGCRQYARQLTFPPGDACVMLGSHGLGPKGFCVHDRTLLLPTLATESLGSEWLLLLAPQVPGPASQLCVLLHQCLCALGLLVMTCDS